MSNNNINTLETTFWKFLSDTSIEIPIIQRDYAQGRLENEYLRKSFLVDIKNSLDKAKDNDKESKMKLDFIYGSVENDKLNPLDGQQRLTTLWLLHWYIALMSDNLKEEVCKTLAKFTYETRISSREFCENLCKPQNFEKYKEYKPTGKRKIVDYITNRTWFYSAWKQDPTIQSMLRMLGGTEKNDKNGDIIDGLEELFQGLKEDKFKEYWECLTCNASIVFYQLPLENFGHSDDLYIKMNARGKQLTSFENFKADLVGYIRNKGQVNPQDWNILLDAKEGIPNKMDTTWTDTFWNNKSEDKRIDEIYFAFLNRFFLCELICQKVNGKYREKIDETPSFKYLYGKDGNDESFKYEDFGKYKYDNEEIPIQFFVSLKKVLDNYSEDPNQYFPQWANPEFQFIPKYRNNTISTLGQKEHVVFLAICRYLEKGKIEEDETKFRQWMRIVWNIVENNDAGMIGAMRLIDELGEYSHDIYNFLAKEDSEIKSEAAKEQVTEEIAKAKQILHGSPRSDGKSWEKVIIAAEETAFFKGTIRFLYQDEKGELKWDEKDFDQKWMYAEQYFDKEGVKEIYQKNAILLRAFVSKFKNWRDFWNFNYDNTASTWKYLLTSHFEATKEILTQNVDSEESLSSFNASLSEYDHEYENLQNEVQNELVKTSILVEASNLKSRLNWIHNTYCLYPSNAKADYYKYVIGNHRNRILSNLCDKGIITDVNKHRFKSGDSDNFFWGWNIGFTYPKDEYYYFEWGRDENIYLFHDNKQYNSNVRGISNENEVIRILDCLIAQAFPDTDKSVCLDCQDKICESAPEQ
ncbi:MAG: DUF262 domain-containing protein [Paludibacteraceae bacterium]|nr:DUF262 domain-containing protein [Paludibacteraceae bacterium]